ncbi:MAG: hypothetical protein ACK521_09890 [bacterium]
MQEGIFINKARAEILPYMLNTFYTGIALAFCFFMRSLVSGLQSA